MSIELILALYELLKEKLEKVKEEHRIYINEVNKRLKDAASDDDTQNDILLETEHKMVKLENEMRKYDKFLKEFQECKF